MLCWDCEVGERGSSVVCMVRSTGVSKDFNLLDGCLGDGEGRWMVPLAPTFEE